MPREGALLTGLRISEGTYSGHHIVKAVQPIFLTPRGKAYGRWYGQPNGSADEVNAQPGYAVGGVILKAGDRIDGLRLIFVRMHPNRLNPRQTYTSDWYGGTGGGKEQLLGGTGQPIIGVVGRAALDIDALGLILAR